MPHLGQIDRQVGLVCEQEDDWAADTERETTNVNILQTPAHRIYPVEPYIGDKLRSQRREGGGSGDTKAGKKAMGSVDLVFVSQEILRKQTSYYYSKIALLLLGEGKGDAERRVLKP